MHNKIERREKPCPDVKLSPEELRVGVFICHCGGNIGNTVDVDRVRETVAQLRFVKCAETSRYLCSSSGQDVIRSKIREHGLERIVVGSCSPRMHLKTFRDLCSSEGINPYLIEMA